jgi:cellulose synthase operon protein YhjQ
MERQLTDRNVGNAKTGTLDDPSLVEEPSAGEVPEDVAILYSWANLQGAKYRDFSASRREYRAQMRRRAAETLREQELKAAAQAEVVATAAEPRAEVAEAASQSFAHAAATDAQSEYRRQLAIQQAELAARKASAERFEADRRAESAAIAESAVLREEREIADPHASGIRQAARYAQSEERARPSAQEIGVPGQISDPYSQQILAEGEYAAPAAAYAEARYRSRGFRPDKPSGEYRRSSNEVFLAPRPEPAVYAAQLAPSSGGGLIPSGNGHMPADGLSRNASPLAAPVQITESAGLPWSPAVSAASAALYGPAGGGRFQVPVQATPVAPGDTLQHSRERVAARWYALKGVFQQPGLDLATELHPNRQNEVHTPILAVFSLAGGVGKTSLVATLGRALSSLGEQVLLADTTSHGLLPFYFGASELIPGVVRNFSPPPGSKDAPIHLVGYDVDRRGEIRTREDRRNEDAGAQDKLATDLLRDSQGTHRVLLDLPATSSWVVRRVARMNPTVLIPLAPDMNSVITLQSVHQFLQSIQNADGHPLSPYFILNQFDPTLPLHIDVREVLRQQLGERLLPFVIHRAPAISEALAEGMTIIDYAPDSVAAQDYLNIASWIRSIAVSTSAAFRNIRWSER